MTQEWTRLTTTQAAEALGTGHDAVWSAIRRGTLEAQQIAPRLNMAMPEVVEHYHMHLLR